MEHLYEQLRVRRANMEKKDRQPNSTSEGQTPPKKTVSFKEEKTVNWLPRQLSWQRNQVDEPSDIEFATAVAAATYAINSLEEGSLNRIVAADGLQASLTKTKSKKEDSLRQISDSGRISRWFSGKEGKEDRGSVGSKRFADEPGKTNGQNTSPVMKTPTSRMASGNLNVTSSGHTDTKADAWEKAELAKIQKRYDKMYSSILEWENKKKTKAKIRFKRKERELQRERERALQEYNDEIARIDKITTGARTVTDEKKRKDVSKVKEKVKVIRSTGNAPRAFLCF